MVVALLFLAGIVATFMIMYTASIDREIFGDDE